MLDTLRAWLNGSREYYSGVALYQLVGDNRRLLPLFKKSASDWCKSKLQEELLRICNELKQKESLATNPIETQLAAITIAPTPPTLQENNNPDLYAACKKEADLLYKEVMNQRAILFALAKGDGFDNPNLPDKIAARSKLAVDVILNYQRVSVLYDKADYVKKYGRLPNDGSNEPENEYDAIPDELVKQSLDNLRKNYNKIKKRDPTPERVALLQKHEANIKKLESKWLLLKPTLQ